VVIGLLLRKGETSAIGRYRDGENSFFEGTNASSPFSKSKMLTPSFDRHHRNHLHLDGAAYTLDGT
jgi:hypothetical protein